MNIKTIEKIAIVMVILYLLSLIPNLFDVFLARLISAEEYGQLAFSRSLLVFVQLGLGVVVQVGVAIWLNILARSGKERPWVWTLFGLVYGLVAVLLFFLLRLYNRNIEYAAK